MNIHGSHLPRSFIRFTVLIFLNKLAFQYCFFIIFVSVLCFFCWVFENICPGGGVLGRLFCPRGRGLALSFCRGENLPGGDGQACLYIDLYIRHRKGRKLFENYMPDIGKFVCRKCLTPTKFSVVLAVF